VAPRWVPARIHPHAPQTPAALLAIQVAESPFLAIALWRRRAEVSFFAKQDMPHSFHDKACFVLARCRPNPPSYLLIFVDRPSS
jgi:hypothetical protein